MGLRERKRRQTRETLAKVAYALFDERGYDDTTVDAIADAANVSPRTFYRYFETKDGVLVEGGYEVVDRTLERLTSDRTVAGLVATMAGIYEELVAEGHFREYARLLRQNPSIADRAPIWRSRWSRHLSDQLAASDGLDATPLEYRLRGAVTIHVIVTAIDEWLYQDRQAPITALADETLAALRAELPCEPSSD